MHQRHVFAAFGLLLGFVLTFAPRFAMAAPGGQPLRALLITGGCCHNYKLQTESLTNAVARQASVVWTIVHEGGNGTRAEIPLYTNAQWAAGYDVVVHNECFADTKSPEYIRRITSAHHAGVPAVVIHCAMHTYRSAEIDDWRQFLGVTSRRHDHQSRYAVKKVAPTHPIVQGIPDGWKTPMDELYIIDKLWPTATALATSRSEASGDEHPVIWTNQYGKARVFGTTYGHSDETFRDPVFLDYVTRGLLWAAGRP
jgi:type 1 glutamine amidotransferase